MIVPDVGIADVSHRESGICCSRNLLAAKEPLVALVCCARSGHRKSRRLTREDRLTVRMRGNSREGKDRSLKFPTEHDASDRSGGAVNAEQVFLVGYSVKSSATGAEARAVVVSNCQQKRIANCAGASVDAKNRIEIAASRIESGDAVGRGSPTEPDRVTARVGGIVQFVGLLGRAYIAAAARS